MLVVSFLLFFICNVNASHRSDWNLVRRAASTDTATIFITLPQRNVDSFTHHVRDIANPSSALYGNWMTKDEVLDWLAPPADVVAAVLANVTSTCSADEIVELDNRRDSVKLVAVAPCIERLLLVRLAVYSHKQRALTCVRYHDSSPRPSLLPQTEFVFGLEKLPVLRAAKKLNKRAIEYNFIDAAAMQRVYNMNNNRTVVVANNTIALIEFPGEGAPYWSDLQLYDQWNNVPFKNFSKIVGPFVPGNDGESLLDVQMVSAVAWTPLQYISVEGWIFGMASELFSMPQPPLVNSISYGWPEALQCDFAQCGSGDSQNYVLKSEIELAKATARGITIVTCSQDEGAPSEKNSVCFYDLFGKPVWPVYPGSSAWVLTVSGTTLQSSSDENLSEAVSPPICSKGYRCATTGTTEVPCSLHNTYFSWTTGGGVADYVVQPSFQSAFVQKYLKSGVEFPKHVNASNRFYPDISAFGSRLLVVSGGAVGVEAGTSAATPIVAGVVTLVNDARMRIGKRPLGFFLPAFYKMLSECPTCFNLVTSGDNRCTNALCCKYGYHVPSDGSFNAATGAGTPNVNEWIRYLTNI